MKKKSTRNSDSHREPRHGGSAVEDGSGNGLWRANRTGQILTSVVRRGLRPLSVEPALISMQNLSGRILCVNPGGTAEVSAPLSQNCSLGRWRFFHAFFPQSTDL